MQEKTLEVQVGSRGIQQSLLNWVTRNWTHFGACDSTISSLSGILEFEAIAKIRR